MWGCQSRVWEWQWRRVWGVSGLVDTPCSVQMCVVELCTWNLHDLLTSVIPINSIRGEGGESPCFRNHACDQYFYSRVLLKFAKHKLSIIVSNVIQFKYAQKRIAMLNVTSTVIFQKNKQTFGDLNEILEICVETLQNQNGLHLSRKVRWRRCPGSQKSFPALTTVYSCGTYLESMLISSILWFRLSPIPKLGEIILQFFLLTYFTWITLIHS